jgi:regulator of nucleoside diphosphate kinase
MSARDIPGGVLTVGGAARIVVSDGAAQREWVVTLRHPDEEDGADGDISVLSPIGLALLGLAAGESAIYRGPDGRSHTVSIEQVFGAGECAAVAHVPSLPPESDDDPGPTAA